MVFSSCCSLGRTGPVQLPCGSSWACREFACKVLAVWDLYGGFVLGWVAGPLALLLGGRKGWIGLVNSFIAREWEFSVLRPGKPAEPVSAVQSGLHCLASRIKGDFVLVSKALCVALCSCVALCICVIVCACRRSYAVLLSP